jgi:integrase
MADKKIFLHPSRKSIVYGLAYSRTEPDYRWRISFKLDGKRHTRYGDINRGRPDHHERYARALRVLDALYDEHRDHQPYCEVRARARGFIERMAPTWSQKTILAHKQVCREYFGLLDGRRPDRKLTEQYTDELRRRFSAVTYNKRRQLLSRILKAIDYGHLLEGIERIKKAYSEPLRIFQRNQQLRLAEYLQKHDPELWRFCQFQFYCFIRPGELRQLRVGDILWDSMEIRMPGTVTKNGKTENAVIPNVFAPVVEATYLMRDPDEYLFPSRSCLTEPIGRNNMGSRHRRVMEQLKYPKGFTLYCWKPTGAVMAIRAGVGVKELMLLMRHSTLQQTDRYLARYGVRDLTSFRKHMPAIGAMVGSSLA